MRDLEGKTAFITGGASGIGLGIAKACRRRGMNVVIADIWQEHLDKAAAELGGEGVLALKLDVTDRAGYARAADAAEAQFGRLHLLVNNAGVATGGPVELATFSDWDWTLGVNLMGVVNGIVTILPRIIAHGEGGHIVSTASMSGYLPHPGSVTYTTSKAAVIAMMEAMRAELEPKGIICSAFCPGPVQSNIAEVGKTRPAELSDTGYADADKKRQQGANLQHLFRPAEEVGERVLEGVLNDELYILTHSEFLDGVRNRTAAMVAAVPNLPENQELKSAYAMLFRNPVHAEEQDRQTRLKGARA
jgi:NAD(P)-dependent dehydrogenase (short-subunit alcohol dehydrogenase family)